MNREARQALYDRIRSSSKDEVILEEMRRLGFWPKEGEETSANAVSEDLIKRQAELQSRLNSLLRKQRLVQNPEEAVKLMRKERLRQSRENQKETKRRNAEKAYQKSKNWWEQQQQTITHLGSGVSAGLDNQQTDADKLRRANLPVIDNALGLARAMGIELAELRFLCHGRKTSRVSHYQAFVIPKKTGGERLISAPKPRLKRAQYWVLDNILQTLPLHDASHGFRPAHSIVSNAKPHVGAAVVINCDLQNFFPSIEWQRIKGLFASFGYSEAVATLLALLCTQQPTREMELDGETWFVGNGARVLPQGAPTSPALTNILCRGLDARLSGMAQKAGWQYTRYADDLTFSAAASEQAKPTELMWRVRAIVTSEGFTLHPDKTRIMRNGNRQEVTGIVVNQKPSLERAKVRQMRAALHRLESQGAEALEWQGQHGLAAVSSLIGFVHYFSMVDAERAKPYLKRVRAWQQAQGTTEQRQGNGKASKDAFRDASAKGAQPWENWWQATAASQPEVPKLLEAQQATQSAVSPEASEVETSRRVPRAGRPSRRRELQPAERPKSFGGGFLKHLLIGIVIVSLIRAIAGLFGAG